MSFVCLTLFFCFSSCSDKDDPDPLNSSEQVISSFKYYFYENGEVNALKTEGLSETEWAIPLEMAGDACLIFNKITGMKAVLGDKYNYSYTSTDMACSLRIEGEEIPEDAIYAIMYIDIPDCPEIRKIFMATPAYFESTNGYKDKIIEQGGEGTF